MTGDAYVIEHRYRDIVVRAELITTGWRMAVYRAGRLTRWDDTTGSESVHRMAEAVGDVMATEISMTPADLADLTKFMDGLVPPPDLPTTLAASEGRTP